jgi:hypothetical protein
MMFERIGATLNAAALLIGPRSPSPLCWLAPAGKIQVKDSLIARRTNPLQLASLKREKQRVMRLEQMTRRGNLFSGHCGTYFGDGSAILPFWQAVLNVARRSPVVYADPYRS